MNNKMIVGIDLSITGPGVCTYDPSDGDFCFENCIFHYLAVPPKTKSLPSGKNIFAWGLKDTKQWRHPEERFDTISNIITSFFPEDALVALEGYSMGSKGKVFDLAENGGVLKHKIWKRSKKIARLIEPKTLKKFATGNGNGTKLEMLDAFSRIEVSGRKVLEEIFTIKITKTKTVFRKINKEKVETLTGNVESPVSDLIDAYWLCRYLYEEIKCSNDTSKN